MRLLVTFILLFLVAGTVAAGDLYKVQVHSQLDARRLAGIGAEPLAQVTDGYLVLIDPAKKDLLSESGLTVELVVAGVNKAELALDNRLDKANLGKYPVVYLEGNFRVFRATPEQIASAPTDLQPIRNERLVVRYDEPADRPMAPARLSALGVPLDSLIGLVSQDSLTTYLLQLQGYPYRAAGTTVNYNSRNWLASKFTAFGYDSVRIDSFTALIGGVNRSCQNILAYKVGTRFPNHHVIFCAHRDAVSASPGADDNGTGTVAVLELARVLKEIPTDMTIIFALFDAEENGLLGSYDYVNNEATVRGDSIVHVLNMDMIAHYESSTTANIYHGSKTTFSNLWISLAGSLVGITGSLKGVSSGSDHYPFTQAGYEASFIQEGVFSTVYHSAYDSSTYLNFEYMTRMVKASLATGYTVSQTASPTGLLFAYTSPLPEFIAPGVPTSLEVTITPIYGAEIVAGTEKIHYSVNGGAYLEAPLTLLSPGQYNATLPATDCNAQIEYYITADETSKGTFFDTDVTSPHEVVVATSKVSLFADDCETNKGWTVNGDAIDGQWSRGVPLGLGQRGDPPTAFGGSGQCWLTDNVYGNSDVDNGTTFLTSPAIDVSSGDARIHFALWYSNSFGAAPFEDLFRVWISNDNGGNWTVATSVGPTNRSDGGWYEYNFWVSNFVTPSSQVRLLFEAADLANGSVVEAAIDDISVTHYDCVPPSCCAGTTGNVNVTGIVDLADLSMLIAYLTVTPRPTLPCADEANINTTGIIDLADLSLLIAYLTATPRPTLPNCP